jgi:hypothetical protein
MSIIRNRARRRSDHAELAALLKFFPHFLDPSWYERYWYAGVERRRSLRSIIAPGRRIDGERGRTAPASHGEAAYRFRFFRVN